MRKGKASRFKQVDRERIMSAIRGGNVATPEKKCPWYL
jgi:sulfate adenylyltransferase subunit 1 (EFTu-like GTPase family)